MREFFWGKLEFIFEQQAEHIFLKGICVIRILILIYSDEFICLVNQFQFWGTYQEMLFPQFWVFFEDFFTTFKKPVEKHSG